MILDIFLNNFFLFICSWSFNSFFGYCRFCFYDLFFERSFFSCCTFFLLRWNFFFLLGKIFLLNIFNFLFWFCNFYFFSFFIQYVCTTQSCKSFRLGISILFFGRSLFFNFYLFNLL